MAFAPFQVVKVRLMAKEHLGRYNNTLDCLVKVVRGEGILALTIGLTPTLWRNCIWDSIYLSGMYNIDLLVPKPENYAVAVVQDGVLGTAMGMFATCFNTPFDVVKSRFQAQLPGAPNPYTSTFGTLRRIVAEEGPTQIYRGLLPKAIRLGVGQTVGLMVFQALVPHENTGQDQ